MIMNNSMNNPATPHAAIPHESLLFTPVRDTYGNRLALVFGNEFQRGECPFYTARQCFHCDIGAGEGRQYTPEMNRERLVFYRRHYAEILPTLDHLVIYNSGSTLNPKEMARETLAGIVTYCASLEKCKVVSLDSREMYVTHEALDYLVALLRDDQQARVILGIESQDDGIRVGRLNKKMTKKGIERAFGVVGSYRGRIGIDVNIVFQPPELIGEEAIREAVATLQYSLDIVEAYKVPIDFNLHPFYPTLRSRAIYPHHPRANLSDARKALLQMRQEIDARKSDAKTFIGWQDEGHDQEPEVRKIEIENDSNPFKMY